MNAPKRTPQTIVHLLSITALLGAIACGKGKDRPIDSIQDEADLESYALEFRDPKGDSYKPREAEDGLYVLSEVKALQRTRFKLEYLPAKGATDRDLQLSRPKFFERGHKQDVVAVHTWEGALPDVSYEDVAADPWSYLDNTKKTLGEISKKRVSIREEEAPPINLCTEKHASKGISFSDEIDLCYTKELKEYVALASQNEWIPSGSKTKKMKDGSGRDYTMVFQPVKFPIDEKQENDVERYFREYSFTRKEGQELHVIKGIRFPERKQDRDQMYGGSTKGTSETFAVTHDVYQWKQAKPVPAPVIEPTQNVSPSADASVENKVEVGPSPSEEVIPQITAPQVPVKSVGPTKKATPAKPKNKSPVAPTKSAPIKK